MSESDRNVTGRGVDLDAAVFAAPAAVVDASGMACPLPILRAKKALSQLASGDVLRVITTDRNAVRDFQAFCRQTGNALLKQVEGESACEHFLRRR